jgi:NAD(P)-dependent dehydrogenase (short-subunit alcohol dehydrogenase family)
MGKMDGKVAMVTGGTSGLGTAVTELFGSEGARVAFCGRGHDEGLKVQGKLRDMGYDITFIQGNVATATDMENFAKKTVELYGQIDAVVCCAGVMRHGTCHTTSEEDWDLVIDTDMKGPWLTCKYALPYMMEKGGTVVIISSMAAEYIIPNQIAYQVAKAGAQMLGKAIAREYEDYNIRCNVIRPGGIATPMATHATHNLSGEALQRVGRWNKLIHSLYGGRSATPAEMAKAVLFFSCDDSSLATGASLLVDGGNTMGLPLLEIAQNYDVVPVNK